MKTSHKAITIPMPWKQVGYSINHDQMRRGRKLLRIDWFTEYGVFNIRIGMIFVADNAPHPFDEMRTL